MYIECVHFHNDYNVNKMRVNLRYANSSSNPSVLESIENYLRENCTKFRRFTWLSVIVRTSSCTRRGLDMKIT